MPIILAMIFDEIKESSITVIGNLVISLAAFLITKRNPASMKWFALMSFLIPCFGTVILTFYYESLLGSATGDIIHVGVWIVITHFFTSLWQIMTFCTASI